MKITIIGAGYVGLVTGVSLAASGRHHVTFVERNPARLDEIRVGRMPIEEPGLTDAFRDARDRISVVDALAAAESPDVVFVAVATPIDMIAPMRAGTLNVVPQAVSIQTIPTNAPGSAFHAHTFNQLARSRGGRRGVCVR